MMSNSVLAITSYDGPYGGNFVASLKALDAKVKSEGYKTVYVFQQKVENFSWIPELKSFADKVYFLPYKPDSFDNIKRIKQIIKQENIRLIYSRMGGWDIASHLAAPKIPIVWHMEMEPNLSGFSKKVKYFGKYRILGGKNVYSVAVSNPGSDSLNSLKLKNKCVAIPNATDFSRLSVKQFENKDFETPVKLLIFSYNPQVKGLDLALDACEIINKNEIMCKLLISAQKLTYEYMENRYGKDNPEWVEILEPTENIASVYENADVILSASRREGFSFCLLEALYSGLPAVYSDIPGTNWADEMKSVYKFKSENVDDLVRAINDCVENGISEENREYNRAIIESKYSLDSWADKFIEYFKSIIK